MGKFFKEAGLPSHLRKILKGKNKSPEAVVRRFGTALDTFDAPTPGSQFIRQKIWGYGVGKNLKYGLPSAGQAHTVHVKRDVARKALNSRKGVKNMTLTSGDLDKHLKDPLSRSIFKAQTDIEGLARIKANFKS